MNLSAPFINRPIMTTLTMLALLLFGIIAFKSLPISDLPNIDYPTITVSAAQPGGSPEYMASLVASPLENQLVSISGLDTMTSKNSIGSTQIVLNFDYSVDVTAKQVEVAQAITAALSNLPPLPTNPIYKKINPSHAPIMFLVLTSSTNTLADLYDTAYNLLAQPLSMLKGISQVQTYGLAFAIRVQADPMKLMSHKLDLIGLQSALVNANPNLASGQVRGQFVAQNINTLGMISEPETYDSVIAREDNGIPLYVGDVADSIAGLEARDPFFHYVTNEFDRPTVILAISRLPESNTLEIANEIYERLPALQKAIPASMELSIFYDKSQPIVQSVEEVEITLIIAVILVVLVIFLYLGKLTETIIPSLVLPMSIISTFIIMLMAGFNLDILSLLALTLSVGFVVDDSIVVMENIVRHIEMEKPPFEAALDGSREISTTVLTMTIALSAVFIPFIWMPGILGRVFHEFAVTIVAAILCSGLISLTLNPMLCSRFLKPRSKTKQKPTFTQRMNAKLVTKYEWLLLHSIHFQKTTLFVGLLCIGLSFYFVFTLKTDFLPAANLDIIQGLHLLQEGSSKVNTIAHMQEINKIIRKNPYQNGFISIANDDSGASYIHLVDSSKRPTSTRVAQQIRNEVSKVVGVNTYLKPFPLINLAIGAGGGLGDYQYTLYSIDSKKLYPAAKEFIEAMQKMPELVGVNSDMRVNNPQLNITIDRDRAGIYGITAEDIERTLQLAYGGGRIAIFSKNLNLYDLILEVSPNFNLLTEDLDLLYIRAPTTGGLVPLTSVATWEPIIAPSSISHVDTFDAVTISFSLAEGVAIGPVLDKIDRLAKSTLPSDIIAQVKGAGEVFRKTFTALKWLFLLAVLVIYLLLGILYESFIHPVTVLSALPVAALGALATLWIFDYPLSLYSVVGIVVLIGIVQKNGIMMIDFALEYREKLGESAHLAIVEACKARFRPILMTTLAAMMGAVPVAIGWGVNAPNNRPVGLVIIGGLLFSQLITLFLTPVVFLYMESLQEWINSRFRSHTYTKEDPQSKPRT